MVRVACRRQRWVRGPVACQAQTRQMISMRHFSLMILLMRVGSCASHAVLEVTPAGLAAGQWTPFYQREFQDGRLAYFYDRSHVQKQRGHILALWKIIGSRGPTTTLYLIDVSCTEHSFTEKGTLLIDENGVARKLPLDGLHVDQAIQPETSAEVFWKSFC